MTIGKYFLYGVVLSAVLLLGSAITQAEEKQPATQIITDEKAGTVSILINGKEVVQIDKEGLHVRGNIEYSGTIADIGNTDFDSHTSKEGGGLQDAE